MIQLMGAGRKCTQKAFHASRITCIAHHVAAQVGNSKHNGMVSSLTCDGYQQVVVIELPVALPIGISDPMSQDVAAYLHMVECQQLARCLESAGRVVVARGDDDAHRRAMLSSIGQKLIIDRLRLARRVAVIKHIARHKQRIGLLLVDLVEQPTQEVLMLGQPVVTFK